MAKKETKGVFIKPVAREEMDSYVDGYGNARDWRAYRKKNLNTTKLQIQPDPKSESITFRALVKSEVPRDPSDAIGEIKNVFYKRGKKAGKLKRKVRKKSKTPTFIQYLVSIQFFGLDFREQESAQYNQSWSVDGKEMFTRAPTISQNRAMIKCQCRDFMMVWEKPLADNGGLWPNNKWTKYNRLTPVTEYPPRNPKEKMGYCKHVQALLQFLYDADMLRNR